MEKVTGEAALRKAALTMVECALRGSLRFHTEYHRLIGSGRCAAAPLDNIAVLWSDRQADPRVMLRRWMHSFLADFGRAHPGLQPSGLP